MKIEKISDNQIRCILNPQDLQERHLKLSEFAYGSGKAKELFQDMMAKASEEYDFEVDNSPLMIEAIPTSAESLILIITKVDNPDELDTRFSTFTPYDQKEDAEDIMEDESDLPADFQGLNQIDNPLFDLLRKKLLELSERAAKETETEAKPVIAEAKLFRFQSFDNLVAFAKSVKDFFTGQISLYHDSRNHVYFLCIFLEGSSAKDFNRICNIACEYSEMLPKANLFYLKEHCKLITETDTLKSLAEF